MTHDGWESLIEIDCWKWSTRIPNYQLHTIIRIFPKSPQSLIMVLFFYCIGIYSQRVALHSWDLPGVFSDSSWSHRLSASSMKPGLPLALSEAVSRKLPLTGLTKAGSTRSAGAARNVSRGISPVVRGKAGELEMNKNHDTNVRGL